MATTAGLSGHRAALAFRLVYDYTLGLALAGPAAGGLRRVGFRHRASTR